MITIFYFSLLCNFSLRYPVTYKFSLTYIQAINNDIGTYNIKVQIDSYHSKGHLKDQTRVCS